MAPGRWLVTTVVDVTDPDSVRASDSEREAAVERLRAASVEGRLTFGELTTRTEAAYSAQTRGELVRVTADLPDRSSGTAPTQQAHAQRMVSVFADVDRRGWWRAEGTVSPMSLFGDVELDLRQAASSEYASHWELKAFALMAGDQMTSHGPFSEVIRRELER